MTGNTSITRGRYSHDLLIHDTDHDLVAATVAFVEQGLHSGGNVLVHSTEDRVAMLRSALGTHPRLEYGLDGDLYQSPMSTLFNYERALAHSDGTSELWVTGTVPFGSNPTAHPAWTRYESLVNEVLAPYAFHALCTYDTRTLPASVVAAARTTHPCISDGVNREDSHRYLNPGDFLADPRAMAPRAPASPPTARTTLYGAHQLCLVRDLIARTGRAASAISREAIDSFVVAVNEVLVNGLQHGYPPVELTLWVHTSKLTCVVSDEGPGIPNPLSGYRYPDEDGPKGLWVARQLCEELVIRNTETGSSVLLTTG